LQPTEYRIRTKSGKVRWVCSSSRPILQNGRAIGLRGIMADIHAKKQAEQEHEKLEAQVQYTQKLESLGILAGGIAHDFNNLLTGILGNASLSLMELPPSSPARECLEDIEKASQRAAELCRQMLAYSGKGQFVVEAVNLSEIVKDIANLLEVSISKKASLRYHFASELPAIEADSTQLRQVIMNLITNASDAIGDKAGVIKITTGTLECDDDFFSETILAENHKPGKYVFVEISDTGCGMDNETQSKIFDPFFTTKFTGRGLGLAAVLGIVRGHKGVIKIDSQQGAGTTFKVFFPCTNGCIKSPKPTFATTETWQGEGTILVVDDEKTVRETSRRILEHIGFQVVTVTDGLEAVDYFQEHFREIKAVLLDMTMPNLNGEETFRGMRSIQKDIRVILMSGYNQQDATNRFSEKGLAGFIHKPFNPEELIAKMREVMES
ncbi:MAG: response regulator, partial [bacterium]